MTPIDRNLNVSEGHLNTTEDNRVLEEINKRIVLNRNELRSTLGTVTYLDVLGEDLAVEDDHLGQVSQNNLLLNAAVSALTTLAVYHYEEKFTRWYNRLHCLKSFTFTRVF